MVRPARLLLPPAGRILFAMPRIVYSVAASLDGFIAGPNGEYDWIVHDTSYDFAALWDRFDTILMGRLTFQVALTRFNPIEKMGKKVVVVSTTLDPAQYPGATVLRADFAPHLARMKKEKGRDIWLMGGGALFRAVLDAGLIDSIEVSVMPVLLGSGVPLIPPGANCRLILEECNTSPLGILHTRYSLAPPVPSERKSRSRRV